MPTRRQLEIFCEAAADCNFRATADRLGLSQPAVSSHIDALERAVGRPLFVRRRGTTPLLSADGHRLLETARQSLELDRRMASGFAADAKQRVVIGMRHYLLETVVRPAIGRFVDSHPAIDLDVRVVDDVAEMVRQVQDGTLDVAVYRGDPPEERGLMIRGSGMSACAIYAAPALAAHLQRDGIALDAAPFIALPESARLSNWIGRRLDEAGITPRNIVRRSQFPDVILQWVLEGRGIGLLFETTAREHVQQGALVKLGPAISPVATILLGKRHVPPAALAVIDFVDTLLAAAAR